MQACRGFSMVEMAMVLVVFSLVMGGALVPLAVQNENRQRRDTLEALHDAVEALYGFAMMEGRLPCPDTDGDGREDSRGCKRREGWLPWADLAVERRDAWGNPWHYRVSRDFIHHLPNNQGEIEVVEDRGRVKVPALVWSDGRQKFDSEEERENRDGDVYFIKHDYIQGRFDDLLVWVSSRLLAAKVPKKRDEGSDKD